MTDVRALMAAERQSRRLTHPQLTYTKSGMLLCNVCHLNVKSESLWEGHLRSANHRKNTLSAQENAVKGLKRKIDDVDQSSEESEDGDMEERKRTKSRKSSIMREQIGDAPKAQNAVDIPHEEAAVTTTAAPTVETSVRREDIANEELVVSRSRNQPSEATDKRSVPPAAPAIDEDEWAAFEREVAPLAQKDYSSATISAAPVSAAEVEAQVEADKRKRAAIEEEDEKEDEERRLEEEFDIMEEMEERVRKLREKREALRNERKVEDKHVQQHQLEVVEKDDEITRTKDEEAEDEEGEDDEDDQVDDWYT